MSPELHAWFIATADALSPALGADIAAVGPLPLPEREDRGVPIFLARAVTGQQLSTKAAQTIWGRLEAATAAHGGDLTALFCEAHAATLRGCGFSANKIKALAAIRAAEEGGHLTRAAIVAMNHLDRSAHLGQIHGIGQWTCDMASIFYCRDPDVWPEGDLAVQRVFARYLRRRSPRCAAARFAPYRSYLALYMWRLVDRMP